MSEINVTERFDNLDRLIAEDNLIRNGWGDGIKRACLLTAISSEVAEKKIADVCPANLIPKWLAYLTPSMDDRGSAEAWPGFVRRYADVVRRAALQLDGTTWKRAEYRVRAACIREAMAYTDNTEVLAVCRDVISLCERVVSGEEITHEEWDQAEKTAARAEGSLAAAWAARAAAWAAARAAAWAARAAKAAARAEGYLSAAWAARAAWDRLNTAILDAIEIELTRGTCLIEPLWQWPLAGVAPGSQF